MSRKSQVMASGLSGVVVLSHLMIASAHLRPNPVEDSQTPADAPMHRITDPAILNLKGTGEPFFPPGLGRSDNPFPFRAIVGRDDRVPMVSRQFPWSAIGRIEGVTADGKRYSCTGTLIAKNIVLTNAHCVINPNTQTVSRIIQFKPNLINGALQDDADVGVVESYYYGTDFKANKTSTDADDWAVLKLDKPLGEKYGFLGWRAPSAPEFAQKSNRLALVGYSADFPQNPKTYGGLELTAGPGLTAGVHQGCSVVGEQAGLLLHDCDTKGGASGGPILAKIGSKHYIVALHAGWKKVDGNVVNYAVKMSQIQAWLNRDSSLRKMGKPG